MRKSELHIIFARDCNKTINGTVMCPIPEIERVHALDQAIGFITIVITLINGSLSGYLRYLVGFRSGN